MTTRTTELTRPPTQPTVPPIPLVMSFVSFVKICSRSIRFTTSRKSCVVIGSSSTQACNAAAARGSSANSSWMQVDSAGITTQKKAVMSAAPVR